MTINPIFHARSIHIELNYNFVCKKVALGLLGTEHISSTEWVVDLFTKPMSKVALRNFWTELCLQPRHSLREGIGTTHHLGMDYRRQRSDKAGDNNQSNKIANFHNSCFKDQWQQRPTRMVAWLVKKINLNRVSWDIS